MEASQGGLGWGSITALAAGPVLLIGWALYASVMSDVKDLRENWVQYRCHPLYMAFAEKIEPSVSTADNFSHCMTLFTHSIFSYALEPIHAMFGMVGGALNDMEGDMGVFRSVIVKLQGFVLSFAANVFGKLLNTIMVLIQQLTTVRDIMHRITGSTGYAAMIIDAVVQSIMSVFNFALSIVQALVIMIFALSIIVSLFFPELLIFTIPLGAALGISFCFAPETQIELQDGRSVSIPNIRIGDVLKDGSVVEGTLVFVCPNEMELFVLDDVVVSGGHLVYHEGMWKSVFEHPEARKYSGGHIEHLYCLITDTHRIPIRNTLFADYEETSDPRALAEIERITYGQPVGEGIVGLHPKTRIPLESGKMTTLDDLVLGDRLQNGETVVGIVWLNTEEEAWVKRGGIKMTHSQVSSAKTECNLHLHDRAMQIVVDSPSGMFLVDNGVWVRDYMDTHDINKLFAIEDIVMTYMNAAS
jgi:hypothetical protein